MFFHDLKDNQKVKALDDIYFVDAGSINITDEEGNVYITSSQIKNGLTIVAPAGTIGYWNMEKCTLNFTILNEDGQEITNDISFDAAYDEEIPIDEELFEIL